MKAKQVARRLARYRVTKGDGFRLRDCDTDPGGDVPRETGQRMLAEGVARLAELQAALYARREWSLLCVIQAMDTGGKDGTIKHVTSGVNPQGVRVVPFKAPSPEELDHDFLWRVHHQAPRRGEIGIFNRSHYEEVVMPRLHTEILEKQRLPRAVLGKGIWKQRLQDIAAFERYLAHQGTAVIKFFLHISREEQKRRLLSRLDHPGKRWKFDPRDVAERALWDGYMGAYGDAIAATAAPHAPWYVVPADQKWYARWVVVEAITATLGGLDLSLPEPGGAHRIALDEARRTLEAEPG